MLIEHDNNMFLILKITFLRKNSNNIFIKLSLTSGWTPLINTNPDHFSLISRIYLLKQLPPQQKQEGDHKKKKSPDQNPNMFVLGLHSLRNKDSSL
jgi:hypothetical protein